MPRNRNPRVEGKDIKTVVAGISWGREYVMVQVERPGETLQWVKINPAHLLEVFRDYAWQQYGVQGSRYKYAKPIMESASYTLPDTHPELDPWTVPTALDAAADGICPGRDATNFDTNWCRDINEPANLACSRPTGHSGMHHAHNIRGCLRGTGAVWPNVPF